MELKLQRDQQLQFHGLSKIELSFDILNPLSAEELAFASIGESNEGGFAQGYLPLLVMLAIGLITVSLFQTLDEFSADTILFLIGGATYLASIIAQYATELAPEKLEYNPEDSKDIQLQAFEAQKERLEENLDSVNMRLIFLAAATASFLGAAVLAGILHFGETASNASTLALSQGAKAQATPAPAYYSPYMTAEDGPLGASSAANLSVFTAGMAGIDTAMVCRNTLANTPRCPGGSGTCALADKDCAVTADGFRYGLGGDAKVMTVQKYKRHEKKQFTVKNYLKDFWQFYKENSFIISEANAQVGAVANVFGSGRNAFQATSAIGKTSLKVGENAVGDAAIQQPLDANASADTIQNGASAICNMMEPPDSSECLAKAQDLAPVALTAAVVSADDLAVAGAAIAANRVNKIAQNAPKSWYGKLVASFSSASGSVKKVLGRAIVKKIAMVIGTAAVAVVAPWLLPVVTLFFIGMDIYTVWTAFTKTAAYQDLQDYVRGNSRMVVDSFLGPTVVQNSHPMIKTILEAVMPKQAHAVLSTAGTAALSEAAGAGSGEIDSWLFSGTGRIIVYGLLGAVTAFVTAEVYTMQGKTEENIQKIDALINKTRSEFGVEDNIQIEEKKEDEKAPETSMLILKEVMGLFFPEAFSKRLSFEEMMKNGLDLGQRKTPCLLKKNEKCHSPKKVMSSRLPTFISYPNDLMQTINLTVQIGEEINQTSKIRPGTFKKMKKLGTYTPALKRQNEFGKKQINSFLKASEQTQIPFQKLEKQFLNRFIGKAFSDPKKTSLMVPFLFPGRKDITDVKVDIKSLDVNQILNREASPDKVNLILDPSEEKKPLTQDDTITRRLQLSSARLKNVGDELDQKSLRAIQELTKKAEGQISNLKDDSLFDIISVRYQKLRAQKRFGDEAP